MLETKKDLKMNNVPNEIFLTGATGFIGKILLYYFLKCKDIVKIHVLVREKRDKTADVRFKRIIAECPIFHDCVDDLLARTNVVKGSLSEIPEIPNNVTHIVHCAASISFNLPIKEAVSANVDPSLALLRRSLSLRNLKSFVHISTAYVNPTHCGNKALVDMGIDPDILYNDCEIGFQYFRGHHHNSYTWSKCLAELLMDNFAKKHNIQLTIVRPSIVGPSISKPWTGWIDSKAALTGLYMLYGLGIMSTEYISSMNVVPVDWVCEVTMEALMNPCDRNDGKCSILHATSEVQLFPLTCYESLIKQYDNTIGLRGRVAPVTKLLNTHSAIHARINELFFETIPLTISSLFGDIKRKRQIANIFDARTNVMGKFAKCSWKFDSSVRASHKNFEKDYLRNLPNMIIMHMHKYDKSRVNLHDCHQDWFSWAFSDIFDFLTLFFGLFIWFIFDLPLFGIILFSICQYFINYKIKRRSNYRFKYRVGASILRRVFRNVYSRIEVDMLKIEKVNWKEPTVIVLPHQNPLISMIMPYIFFQFTTLGVRKVRAVVPESAVISPLQKWTFQFFGVIVVDDKINPTPNTTRELIGNFDCPLVYMCPSTPSSADPIVSHTLMIPNVQYIHVHALSSDLSIDNAVAKGSNLGVWWCLKRILFRQPEPRPSLTITISDTATRKYYDNPIPVQMENRGINVLDD